MTALSAHSKVEQRDERQRKWVGAWMEGGAEDFDWSWEKTVNGCGSVGERVGGGRVVTVVMSSEQNE